MKKDLIKVLSLSATCLSLVSCGAKDTPSTDLFWAHSTENLMSDWDYRAEKDEYGDVIEENKQYRNRDCTLRFNCLKGENEGVQLMINPKRNINSFDFILPDVSDGKNVIKAENFSVAAAWYMDVFGSNEKSAYSGLYPDALIPLDKYKWRRQNQIKKGMNQSLYINLLTTKDMKAGIYKGEGTLILDEERTTIPFEIKIYDAVMPEEVHKQSCYLIWYDQIGNGEKRNDSLEMHEKYYDFILSKRISPDNLPDSFHSSPEVFANTIYERVANNPKVSFYRMPLVGNSFTAANVKNYLNALIEKNVEVRKAGDTETDLFKKVVFYVDDEPLVSAYEKVKEHDKLIFDTKVELSSKLNAYPNLKSSFLKIKNLVTTPYNESLVATNTTGGVQTWCPQYQNFQTPAGRELYAARQKSNDRDGGENVWWYGCMDPVSPYVSFHLDADLLNSRILSYMEYSYNIEGNLFWSVNYFSKYSWAGITSARDIWHDPISWANCAGDGYLVFPGVEYNINGPITTLRLESILASNEEYEYLWMIEQKVNEYNSLRGTSYVARTLLQKYFNRIFKNVIATDDDEEFDAVRIELLNLLEAFEGNLSIGMGILLGD
ncbi:MAG: DUF4091 domain-containing protein [Bacilli bacterium]|nr:DUF4091 domain-containing protein [Bacilli bacterium]